MSNIDEKEKIETTEVNLDFTFEDPKDIKNGIAKVKVAHELYEENSPLTKKQIKELREYEKGFSEKFLEASNKEAVKLLIADDSIQEVVTSTKFGVHTYGKLEGRAQREVTIKNVSTGESYSSPKSSMKTTYGNIGKAAIKRKSKEYVDLLAEG